MNILGVIPARLPSTRLPRKVLREIAGVPMVVHVFRRAHARPVLSDLLVATDSEEVVEACHAHHVPAVMTRADHPSGTDRLWEVSRARAADVYVNIQGDEPLDHSGPHRAARTPLPRRAGGPGDHAQDPRHAGRGREPHRQQGGHQRPRRRPVLLAPAHPLRPRQPRRRHLLEAHRSLRLPPPGARDLPLAAAVVARAGGAAGAAPAAGGRHPDPRARDPRAHHRRGHRGGSPGRQRPSCRRVPR